MLPEKSTKTIEELKAEYVAYFSDVPVQKYAAMFIRRNEDTIIRWKKEDQDFADAIQKSKAEWIRKRLIATKAEFALERLEKGVFGKIDEPPQVSTYQQFINSNQFTDPNTPDNKKLVDDTLAVLMEKTKWKQPTERQISS